MSDRWDRLQRFLERMRSGVGDQRGRVGAVLALLADRDGLEFVLTRRHDELPTHPGQLSFPGGRKESGETLEQAALREAGEEIALDPASVTVLGRLPAFYLPPSRIWLAAVVARWDREHPLRRQESEVTEIVRAPVARLLDPESWRSVRLSMTGWSWAWQLDADHLLWGATANLIVVLLEAMEPGWSGGVQAADLTADREVMPWLDRLVADRRPVGPRLPGLHSRQRETASPPEHGRPGVDEVERAGEAIAQAVLGFDSPPARVVVLAGSGGNGAAGLVAAARLAARGVRVTVVQAHPRDAASPAGVEVTGFTGRLPPADLYVDALVGGGLRGQLRGPQLDILLALREHDAAILAVDLPSGLDPNTGLVGEALAATVTLALGGVWPAAMSPALAPFVGDLYLLEPSGEIVRLVGSPDRDQLTEG